MTGFSPVRLLGRISPGSKGTLFGPSLAPRPDPARLPPADHGAILARLAPGLTALQRDRAAHVDRMDRTLTLCVGGAALAGLVLGLLAWGDLLVALFLMGLAALGTLILLLAKSEAGPRAATRTEILRAVTAHMSDLTVDPSPSVTCAWFGRLHLMQPVRRAFVDLRLTGQRAGRKVTVSRVGLMFGADKNYTEKPDEGLTFVMVQIALPETSSRTETTAVMPRDAALNIRSAPTATHGLAPVATGDADFDALYRVYGDPAPLTPTFRTAFRRLEACARCAEHAMAEVPPGKRLRPWVAILPAEIVVLTPIAKFDGAFEPPPYWQPLDPDLLIPAFAADLAVLDLYLTAALSLPFGEFA